MVQLVLLAIGLILFILFFVADKRAFRRGQQAWQARHPISTEEFIALSRYKTELTPAAVEIVRNAVADEFQLDELRVLPNDQLMDWLAVSPCYDNDYDDVFRRANQLASAQGIAPVRRQDIKLELDTAEEIAQIYSVIKSDM